MGSRTNKGRRTGSSGNSKDSTQDKEIPTAHNQRTRHSRYHEEDYGGINYPINGQTQHTRSHKGNIQEKQNPNPHTVGRTFFSLVHRFGSLGEEW